MVVAAIGSIGVRELGVICTLAFFLILLPFLVRWLMSGRGPDSRS